jgi:6,7-dimethyl-8-ribityllumazine synthase
MTRMSETHSIREGINIVEGRPTIAEAAIAIAASRYNGAIVDRLLDACIDALCKAGVDPARIVLARVPGAFEIPVAVARLVDSGHYDAVIAIGAVIRGETPHFEFIAAECAHGLAETALRSGVPVIFGVLTVDNIQQALDRSGDPESNKGTEAANTAIEMITLLRALP